MSLIGIMIDRYGSPNGVYLLLVIMSFNSIIASRFIIQNMGKLYVPPRVWPPVGTVLNGYAIGFPLVLSALVLISVPLIIFDNTLGSPTNIAKFILYGTIMPALVCLIGCLVAWRNLGIILGARKAEPAT